MSAGSGGRGGAWADRWGLWASFAWGTAEATLFFIVPDVIVGAVALVRPRRGLAAAAAAIGGALVGGTVLYLVGVGVGSGLRTVIGGVPGISAEMAARAQQDLGAHGGAALLIAPFSGIPYKLYAAEWALRGWGLPALLAWTVPARAVRIVPVALAGAAAGTVLRGPVGRRPRRWLGLYLLVWAVIYVLYFRANGF